MSLAELSVLALPLMSAVTVALVGVLTRSTADRLTYIALNNTTGAFLALPFLLWAPFPTADAWTLLGLTTAIHWAYQWSMIRTLSYGDLSLAFPIMRGVAPIIIALFASFALEEHLSATAWLGLSLATVALVAFGLIGHRFRSSETDPRIFVSALITAVLVASYSVVDGAGVRAMGADDGWGYIMWFFVVSAVPMIGTAAYFRRHNIPGAISTAWRHGTLSGVLSFFSYGAAMFAMGIMPIAHVAAIRETSVVFASIFGWWLLSEKFGLPRVGLSVVIVAGLAILRLS